MSDIRVNFGCGLNAPNTWTNYDSSLRVWVDRLPLLPALGYKRRFSPWVKRLNVTGRLPYDDASVQYVYSSHMIEHLTREDANHFLNECARIIGPNGRIRIMTPNIRFAVSRYITSREDPSLSADAADTLMSALGIFEENENANVLIRGIRKLQQKNTHKWLYDENNLKALLETCGFKNVIAKDNWVSDFPDLDGLEPANLRAGSVCVEGHR